MVDLPQPDSPTRPRVSPAPNGEGHPVDGLDRADLALEQDALLDREVLLDVVDREQRVRVIGRRVDVELGRFGRIGGAVGCLGGAVGHRRRSAILERGVSWVIVVPTAVRRRSRRPIRCVQPGRCGSAPGDCRPSGADPDARCGTRCPGTWSVNRHRGLNTQPFGTWISDGGWPGIGCSRVLPLAVHPRHRAEQAPGVGHLRVVEDLVDRARLHALAAVHDQHLVAGLGDDAEVVGDQDDRRVELASAGP